VDDTWSVWGNVYTALDAGLRVVEWRRRGDGCEDRRAGRFQEQRWNGTARAWEPTGRLWTEHDWCEGTWWLDKAPFRRGPLNCYVPDGVFLFLGAATQWSWLIGPPPSAEGPGAWACGRFAFRHQCAGYGMAQAHLDGAFFLVPPDDPAPIAVELQRLAGPYEVGQLTDAGADEVAAKVGALLEADAFPSDFDRPCGEGLHLFRLSDGVVKRITQHFAMVASLDWRQGPVVGELTSAPNDLVATLKALRRDTTEPLVAAFVYENCD